MHPLLKKLYKELLEAPNNQERTRILQSAGQRAREDLPGRVQKLEELLLAQSPFPLLARFSYYFLTYLPEVGKRSNESDPTEQSEIEIAQALILCHEESEFQKERACTPEEFQAMVDLLKEITVLQSMMDYADIRACMSGKERQALEFHSILRGHTKSIRGWGYDQQQVDILKSLYQPLEDEIHVKLGVQVNLLVDMFRTCVDQIERKLQDHFTLVKGFMTLDSVRGVVKAYLSRFKDPYISVVDCESSVADGTATLKDIKGHLMVRSDAYLHFIYALGVSDFLNAYKDKSDLAAVQRLVHQWSLALGSLRSCKREHLFLNNPLWHKPLMNVAPGIIFWPIPSLFHSFCFEMMQDLVRQDATLYKKYLARRGVFLEEYTSKLFKQAFPEALHFRGSLWNDTTAGRSGENDLLVVFDSMALVIEQKAGAINPIARRGGPSLSQEIDELLIDPARQAQNFAALLQAQPGVHEFNTKSGCRNVVDTSTIKQIFCLTITLERLGPLAAQVPRLQAAGLAKQDVPPVPSMSLADLGILLKFLQSPFELLHYLTRRASFERRRTFIADELDLLTLYLRTGLCGAELPDVRNTLGIYGLSQQLNPYFQQTPSTPVPKPQRKLSKWWKCILEELSRKKVPRRFELGCILLDLPFDRQQEYEKRVRNLCRKVKRRKTYDLQNVEGTQARVYSEVRDAAIVAVPVRNHLYHGRKKIVNQMALQAMEQSNVKIAVVILIDVDCDHWPYSGIYVIDQWRETA
jgi:hypothetical protein